MCQTAKNAFETQKTEKKSKKQLQIMNTQTYRLSCELRQKKLIISLALIGYNGDVGCVLFFNIFYFLVIKGEDAA